jgi:hypothetical protein
VTSLSWQPLVDWAPTDHATLLVNTLNVDGQWPLSFDAWGLCPGTVLIQSENGTPGGSLFVLTGGAGSSTIPSGTCAGTTVELSNARAVRRGSYDAAGDFQLAFEPASAAACRKPIAVIDMATCEVAYATMP